jgi:hypothetical protein
MAKLWRTIRWPFYHISMVKHPDLGYGIRKRILFWSAYKDLKLLHGRPNSWWWTSGSRHYYSDCWDTDMRCVRRIYRGLTPLDHITVIQDDIDVALEVIQE